MKIIDRKLLNEFRGPGPCDYCGAICAARQAAHIFSSGIGGACRLDVRINLVALGGPFECGCHARHHDGHRPKVADLLNAVARREGIDVRDIAAEIWKLIRSGKPNVAKRKPISGRVAGREATQGPGKEAKQGEMPMSRRGHRGSIGGGGRGKPRGARAANPIPQFAVSDGPVFRCPFCGHGGPDFCAHMVGWTDDGKTIEATRGDTIPGPVMPSDRIVKTGVVARVYRGQPTVLPPEDTAPQ